MFNIGPMELLVLALVGLIVLGPDKLPGLARDAARMLRTLRDLAQGARTQLRDELGPEFADVDLRNLNPRTAIQRAVLGDDVDLDRLNPRSYLQDVLSDDEPEPEISLQKTPQQQPLGRDEAAPFDPDAT
jgi:sec-independent protein translocase protein TatB